MVDKAPEQQIVVSENQGKIDGLTAALRLLAIIFATAPAAAVLVKKHDLVGLYNFFQSQPGVALLGAVGGLVAAAYAVYKSTKRGSQIATVAASPAVPERIATTK